MAGQAYCFVVGYCSETVWGVVRARVRDLLRHSSIVVVDKEKKGGKEARIFQERRVGQEWRGGSVSKTERARLCIEGDW